MDTLQQIFKMYKIDLMAEASRMPIEIRDMNREDLAYLFGVLGFKVGAEIGVRDGGYSKVLMEAIQGLTLYGVDPYEPHHGYRDITKKSTFEGLEKQAHNKLDMYEHYHFVRRYSADAVKNVPDNSLDFVYIDGDHSFYEATHDIEKWSKKVRPGGIISGDDYFKHKGDARIHVYQVVNGYTESWGIRPWFVVGAPDKVTGEKRDNGRSWFWVKE